MIGTALTRDLHGQVSSAFFRRRHRQPPRALWRRLQQLHRRHGAEAAASGVSRGVIDQALAGVTLDPAVLTFDRRQRGTFRKTFEDYAATRVAPGASSAARQMLAKHAALLRASSRFGVPPEIIVAIWGLMITARATSARCRWSARSPPWRHDCRRTELFQGELLAALKIVQRGDLPLRDMIGAFAGEIGQTQFLPSSYIKYGVDFDGNGHVDLRHSIPDVLASTANLLHVSGFRNGAPYGEGTANFEAMREWNRATIYRKTIVFLPTSWFGEGRQAASHLPQWAFCASGPWTHIRRSLSVRRGVGHLSQQSP
jgi:membrane-bound lytic murein transglycosylase B